MNWHEIETQAPPRDRPVAFLSVQPQEGGGHHISIDVVQWRVAHGCFTIGYRTDLRVGHDCGTHWCEVEELNLPC